MAKSFRGWQSTPVFLPREFHGQRSVLGYSPWGCTESDTTEVTKNTHAQVASIKITNMQAL